MAQVGRISGPLLTANLERNGIDLKFRNNLDKTSLLYFDAANNRIGVNTDTVTDVDIQTVGTTRVTDLLSDEASLSNFSINSNNINVSFGDINLDADEAIIVSTLETEQFYINDNFISTKDSNANIEFNTNSTGRLIVGADDSTGDRSLNVRGNLHATGDITFDGSIIFGDDSTVDTVSIDSEINSDIIPNRDLEFSLGSAAKRWGYISSELLNVQQITADVLSVGGINLEKRVGNIFYVSVNGSDSNSGDHVQDPFKTIKHALSQVDPSTDGPVEIRVFPGDYQEELPLEIPSNVTVRGTDLRTTVIRPDTANQSEDVFLMNGESSVAEITIKDFFYDSINDKGYAFRFAPNATITSRSPYIQNITVITQGSTITVDDPRGFASGDAGKGALVDGADVLSTSNDASMLFHSVTFITPGVDALTMTNGVKVEWLNSFSYFANRGLYAFNGTTGHLSTDGSTTLFGAELRSIGSANVYGNYGAVADGDDCLMYLIMHNFGYVGAGKLFDNDTFNAIQANEVVELNSGRIRYQSTNHQGNFRVGNNFLVDYETGSTTLDISTSETDSFAGLVITTGPNRTLVTGETVEVGNFNIRDNLINTILGDINVNTVTNETNITSNVFTDGNLDIIGNFSYDGNLEIGEAANDTVDFNVQITQDLNPNQTETYSLGLANKVWTTAYLGGANFGDIEINDNYITTEVSNASLELRANGTGIVSIPSNHVIIEQDLTVNGTTNVKDVNITGALNQTGNHNISQLGKDAEYLVTNLTISNNLTIGSQAQFEEILFDGNVITSTSTNTDLELCANGTGNVIFDENVVAENNFTVSGTSYTSDINVATSVEAVALTNDIIDITSNEIKTVVSNANLDLTAAPDGIIDISNNDVVLGQNFKVDGLSTLLDTNITGNLVHTGNKTQTGNITHTGNFTTGNLTLDRNIQLENIEITGNLVHTTQTNSDLDFRANGTGRVVIEEDLDITQNVTISTLTANIINISGDVDLNEIIIDGAIEVDNNVITTTDSNANLELRANGDGILSIPSNDVTITNALSVNGLTDIDITTITGAFLQTGNTARLGNTVINGNFILDGQVSLDRGVDLEEIKIDNNVITTTSTNANLELRAAGTGVVRFEDVQVDNNINVGSLNDVQSITVQNTVLLDTIELSTDIQLFDNVIATTNSNSNLELRANGTGDVLFENNLFVNDNRLGTKTDSLTFNLETESTTITSTNSIVVPNGTTQDKIESVAGLRFNTNNNVFEITGSIDNINVGGVYSSDVLTSITTTNSNDIQIFVDGYTQDSTSKVAEFSGQGSRLHGLQVDDILFDQNIITTNVSNSNLDLITDGTGSITIDSFTIKGNEISLPADTNFEFKTSGNDFRWITFEGDKAIKWPAGPGSSRPLNPKLGTTRVNTDTNELETWVGDQWRTSAGEFASISEADMEEEAFVQTLIYG